MRRIMIAGTSSGSGKTTIVCALLRALQLRGKKPISFKCGPDYIDPMFHREIVGSDAGNLDGYFMDSDMMCSVLRRNEEGHDIAVLEGVMGYYDGLGMEDTASSHDVAVRTKTPVVLVMDCKKSSRSLQAQLKGFLEYMEPSGIVGVIFNRLSPALYPAMQDYCKGQGIAALGVFPDIPEASIESRHLGLVTAPEIADLQQKLDLLAKAAGEQIDMDGLWELAADDGGKYRPSLEGLGRRKSSAAPVRIGIARDAAFCFYYEENLRFLQEQGCELVSFSPLQDTHLPENISGLLLGGGYPELFGRQLAENETLRREIRDAAHSGMAVHGECGGFLYLHRELVDTDGRRWPMVGVFDGSSHFTGRLQHFGYVTMTANRDNILCEKGEQIRAHEFHRYVSNVCQDIFSVRKGDREWGGYAGKYRVAAGFGHIHYLANPKFGSHFAEACRNG